MNLRLLFLPVALALVLPTGTARADRNPDFDDDATPILSAQPDLVQYVHHHFDVKDTGIARIPGADDRAPQPPFIFSARPRNSDGPYYLRLLVQPGPPGHILKMVDMRNMHLPTPSEPPASFHSVGAVNPAAAPFKKTQPQPAPASTPSAPTADTPSGPIPDTSSSPNQLAPPADPAPASP
jgi:hypothetical protein